MKKTGLIALFMFAIVFVAGCTNVVNRDGVIAPENKTEIIQKLFADKYNKNLADIVVTIAMEDASHARGGVKIGPGVGAGGNFLVAKNTSGSWTIVADGNGQFFCEDLAQYNFPPNMSEGCASKTEMNNTLALKKAFTEKFDKKITDIEVNITKQAENKFFKGNVTIGTGVGSKSMFLAVLDEVENEMKIVASGSGTYSCTGVAQYNFPADFISDCSR